jgi:hypothetical protein
MTEKEMLERIALLEKQVANKSAKGTALKIGEKGGVSFYGVGRRPVTLYASQWETVFAHIGEIKAFVEVNKAKGLLATKPAKEETTDQPSV